MDTCEFFRAFTLLALFVWTTSELTDFDDDARKEICQLETMKARCRWNSEVIVMTSARWGRMKTGRCLKIHQNLMAATGHDPLFLGCSEDVLKLVDRKCSGRSECDIRIPDPDLDKVTPCYADQTRYLEASYTCVRVIQESRTCVVIVTADSEFISSLSSSSEHNSGVSSSCGSKSHPWRLEAPAGQRINISLIDFAGGGGSDRPRDHDVSDGSCVQYGFVVEKLNKKNVSLCAEGGAERQRESAVYTSDTNSVEIVLVIANNQRTDTDTYNFLIKVQAIGCTNIVPPDNAWLKRSNNEIIIGCYSSQQTWQLKCDGHEWKGRVGTCPELYAGTLSTTADEDKSSDGMFVFAIMVAIAGTALIICLTIMIVGCLCLKRYKQSMGKKSSMPSTMHSLQSNGGGNTTFVRLPVSAGTQPAGRPQNYNYCSDDRQFLANNVGT